jgi:aspartyl/glutamyl-tRNA(Asn/Gln) amidotransferase C subunit
MVDIKHLAKLSQMTVTPAETKKLADQFAATLDTVALLETVDTSKVNSTFQVTGLQNVFRADKIDRSRCLTQKQALANAKKTHRGYFLVPAIFK